MSKSQTQLILLPGETTWEIWSREDGGSFELRESTEAVRPGDVIEMPAGELTLLFGLRSITALPMRVMTTESELFEDLASLHAERQGMRADPLAGQLNDLFEVAREEESTVLLSAWLKTPGEGDLPLSGPKAFDFSARALPVEGDAIVLWRELNRWVFAVHQGGRLLYAQATAVDNAQVTTSLAQELKFALMQLSMQGLEPKPTRLVVWSLDSAIELGPLEEAFELPVETAPRPQPVLPNPISKLLPEDVRAARREAQKRQRARLGVMALCAVYFLLIAWLASGLIRDSRKASKLDDQAALAAPEVDAYKLHMDRWRELENAIDIDHYPVEILHRVAGCIPPKSGVRLTSAQIDAYEIKLYGEAPSTAAANQFSLKLGKNPSLERFEWDLPNSDPNGKTGGRKFEYYGNLKNTPSTP